MWKLLKELPKSWKNKFFIPLGSNPRDDVDDDSCGRYNKNRLSLFGDGHWNANDKIVCKCTESTKEPCAATRLQVEVKAPKYSEDNAHKCPFQRYHQKWIFTLMNHRGSRLDISQLDLHKFSFVQVFCTWFHAMVKRKYGIINVREGIHHDNKHKLCYRLNRTLIESANHNYGSSTIFTFQLEESPSFYIDQDAPVEIGSLDRVEEFANRHTSILLNAQAKDQIQKGQYESAVNMFERARELGLPEASFNLGVCYESGLGLTQDVNKALELYNEAADRDHGGAMHNAAVFYLEGRGIPKNEELGTSLMNRASKRGIKEACTYMGVHFARREEYVKAVEMFQKAADLEAPEGLYYLGVCHENGLGVEINMNKAAELYVKASSLGNQDACNKVDFFRRNGLGGLLEDCAQHLQQNNVLSLQSLQSSSRRSSNGVSIVFEYSEDEDGDEMALVLNNQT